MAELIEANWILLAVALVIGLIVAFWIFVSSRRTTVQKDEAPEEEEKGAKRNQALIDAPPAAGGTAPPPASPAPSPSRETVPPATPGGLAGAGEAVQTAATPAPSEHTPPADAAPRSEPESSPEPAPSPAPAPAPVPAPAPTPTPTPAASDGDDLTRIKGLGPKLQTRLGELGVTRLDQIATWDDAEIDRIDAELGRFQGRIRRDNWVEQARLLASGDTSGYEDRFGKL